MFVRDYGYTLTEHHPTKPWLVMCSEHRSISLPDDEGFFDWAAKEWPVDRFTVELDPWALDQERGRPKP